MLGLKGSHYAPVLIDSFLVFADSHLTKIHGPLPFILSFEHDHSTKIKGHSYSLIYSFLSCVNVSYAIFTAVLPLCIPYTVFMVALPLYFVPNIHCLYILYAILLAI